MISERYDFVVDTKPMADSVNNISGHINGTTTAVVAMQAAVIAAEEKAAKKICDNVDSGFYNLIRSQNSMKLASYFTEMNVKLSLLLEYAKSLNKTKGRMENDFHRLRREYSKIFHGLDSALEHRITQLDKPAMALAETRKKAILSKFLREVSESVTISDEAVSVNQKITTARLKNKTSRSLKFLGNKVHENLEYASLMDTLMEKKAISEQYEEYIPVVYSSEQSMLAADSFVLQFHYPEYLSDTVRNNIGIDVMNNIEAIMNEQQSEIEKQEIHRSFCEIISSESMDPRVAKVMMELYERGGCR